VDLTGLFAAVVLAAVLLQAVRGRVGSPAALWVVGLWLTFLVGAAGGLWFEGGPYKVALLFTVTLLCALAPGWLLLNEESRRWLIVVVVIAGLGMAAALLVNPDREVESLYGRLTLEGSNSIGTARVVGAGAAVALVKGLGGRKGGWIWLGSAAAMAAVLVLVGSRGPFVGFVTAVVVALLLGKNGRGVQRVWVSVLGLLAVSSLLLVVATSQNQAAGRIAAVISGTTTDETRLALVQECLVAISHHVLGIGWGGFSAVALEGALQGRYSYPHNMVLEIFAEGGWLAGAAFLGVVAVAVTGFWRQSNTPQGVTLFTMGLYWILVAQTSGDVNANRMTWVMLGLGLVLHGAAGRRLPLEHGLPARLPEVVLTPEGHTRSPV
jgi:O-antigen ligase